MLISEMQPMSALVVHAQAATRFALLLIGLFAVIAGLLASIGLYGVLATFVRLRTAEIGVRMALGASPSNILRLVVEHGLGLSTLGIAVGIVAAIGLTRLMTTMLVGVPPTDPVTFLAIIALFLVIAVNFLLDSGPPRRCTSAHHRAAGITSHRMTCNIASPV
jgi:putative ABC transport system permease protein